MYLFNLNFFVSLDNSIYGSRSIIDQANDYLECARENLYLFKVPEVCIDLIIFSNCIVYFSQFFIRCFLQIVFHFASGIEASLAHTLKNLEVLVEGEIIDDGSGLLVESKLASPEK